MKDNVSTRTVLEKALQLGYRYPLDVRCCKARWLTCQEPLYRNSEQQNAMPEANCHKEEKKKKKEKRKGLWQWNPMPQCKRIATAVLKGEVMNVAVKRNQNLNGKKHEMLSSEVKMSRFLFETYKGKKTCSPFWKKINVREFFWTKILLSHLVAALYNPPPTADQRAVPPEQAGGLNASLKGTSMVVSLAWESITHSLCPPRFSLLANGFASGQKALHLLHPLPCFHLKNCIFFGISAS